jgi:predicted GNAT family acetyltransferase
LARNVVDASDRERYEALVDGELAGVLEYKVRRDRIALVHTEVLPAFRGQGIATELARFALHDARQRHRGVIAVCPSVQAYLERHPEERDVVVSHRPPDAGS